MVAAGQGTAPGTLVLVLPPLTYFSLFLWQKARRAWVPEVLLLVVLGTIVLVRYRTVLGLEYAVQIPAESRYAVQPNPAYAAVKGQRLLVLGNDQRSYLYNRLATPYLDWSLAQTDFGHLNEYAAVSRLAHNFAPTPPDYIIDKAGLLPELRYKIPAVFGKYQLTATPRVYKRVTK
jgi:hypothetical protein